LLNFPFKEYRVCALIVLYNPDLETLEKMIESLLPEVKRIFIFDNSPASISNPKELLKASEFVKYYYFGENIGIAAAQNWLLKEALAENFDFAIISDQDTIYPVDYTRRLLKYFHSHDSVIAVCPGWLDVNLKGQELYPGQYVLDSRGKLKIDFAETEYLKISHAISSGMIINLDKIEKVGYMNEDLFIDWVDNDWCWRALQKGFSILAVPAVKVRHKLGEATVIILGKRFVMRSSIRNYYIIRNALFIALFKRNIFSIRVYLIKKILHHSLFSFLASSNKVSELSFISKAWLHGMLARLGPLNRG
jgi:rhamnosyltransferase